MNLKHEMFWNTQGFGYSGAYIRMNLKHEMFWNLTSSSMKEKSLFNEP